MKKIFTLLFAACCGILTAQQTQPEHSVALVVSPDFSFTREASPNNLHDGFRLGYRARLDYFNQLAPRIFLKTGFGYAEMNFLETLNSSDAQWPSQNNGNGQFDPTLPGESGKLELKYTYRFLQVPFGVRFHLTTGKIKWLADVEGGVMLRTERKNQNGIQPYIGVSTGLGTALPGGFALAFQPAYRYHVRSNYPEQVAGLDNRVFFHSLGLEMSVSKSF